MPASALEEDLLEISKKLTRMSKDVDRQVNKYFWYYLYEFGEIYIWLL